MQQKKQTKSYAKVASIQTEYVRSLQQKESRKNARKVRLYRRLTVFAVIAVLALAGLSNMYMNQKKSLALKEQEKEELLEQLELVKTEQATLNRQLVKLNDDDYIAKLARKEYFLSEGNEVIFSTPKNKKKEDEKENGKE
jgi:cell division protein DivIC